MNNSLTFVDLFSGCGGLSLGLLEAGWKGLFAIEKCDDAFKTLKHNLIESNSLNFSRPKFNWPPWLSKEPHDVRDFSVNFEKQMKSLRGSVTLVAGGPPCQGFSLAGRRHHDDPRNQLFQYYLHIVNIIQPALVLIENVQGIDIAFSKTKNGTQVTEAQSYAQKICELLTAQGYDMQQHIIRACDFGVPQLRPRYYTLGIRRDLNRLGNSAEKCLVQVMSDLRTKFLISKGLPDTRPVTVYDAISDLAISVNRINDCIDPESPPGFKQIDYICGPQTSFQHLMHGELDRQPNSLRLANHRPETVRRYEMVLENCRKGVQLSKAERMKYDIRKTVLVPVDPHKPSPTITTIPDDLLHYCEPRIHTVREYARLQTFPDWFEFKGKYTTGGRRRAEECPRYTQVGNAVPPLLAELIGLALAEIMNSYK